MKETNVKIGSNKNYNIKGMVRNRYLFILDLLIIPISYVLALLLINNIFKAVDIAIANIPAIIITDIVFLFMNIIFGVYTVMWIYGGTKDYLRITWACAVSSVVSLAINMIIFETSLYFKISFCVMVIASVAIIGSRMLIRAVHNLYNRSIRNSDNKRLLIIGAGSSATIVLRDMANNGKLNYDVVGFIDDDPDKRNIRIYGEKVLGNRKDIPKICREQSVDEILIALPSASMQERKKKMEDLADAFIVVPGGIGTFEEMFEVLTLKQLGRHKKPIIFYNLSGYFDNLMKFMRHCSDEGFIRKNCHKLYNVSEVDEKIFDFVEHSAPLNFSVSDLKHS